jgi:hypothetical protein
MYMVIKRPYIFEYKYFLNILSDHILLVTSQGSEIINISVQIYIYTYIYINLLGQYVCFKCDTWIERYMRD